MDTVVSLLDTVKVLGINASVRSNRIRRFSEKTFRGYYITRALMVLRNVGLLKAFERQGAVSISDFAQRNNLDIHILSSLCDYLYGLGILNRRGDSYAFSPRKSVAVEAIKGPFLAICAYQDVFQELEGLLHKDKVYGVDVNRRLTEVSVGSGAAGKLLIFPMAAELLVRHGFTKVLDLACGDGTFLIDLCERQPSISGYGLDISAGAIDEGRQIIQSKGLQDRLELLVEDIFQTQNIAGRFSDVKAITCIYALHEFLSDDQQQMLTLLRGLRSSFPNAALVVGEVIYHTPDELHKRPGWALEVQLFHDLSGQRLATREQWTDLFRRAGYTDVQDEYMAFARTALFVAR
jgi:SAM-dependent methyltransferase